MPARKEPASAFGGLQKAPRKAHPLAPEPAPAEQETGKSTATATPSRTTLVPFSTRITPELLKEVRRAAVDKDMKIHDITIEALTAWLGKHR
ncbi:hypothetical protein ONR57_18130 [Hoyosella sp. YIM 151337]|uniref:hypothetical protein n=1 Tax=Hoyosella sp. YIM 151337 TaxID=2992742 RepID=UPI00223622E9|nr:hypothetical protein [Hoyosella sp. YIM 151337]MCW4355226.1 hypothetical protein [Hoyosella sp. YIM 151337]